MAIRHKTIEPGEYHFGGIPCPKCGAVAEVERQFDAYFDGTSIKCGTCQETIDWWEAILNQMDWGQHFPSAALQAVGARHLIIHERLERCRFLTVDLAERLPASAQVLHFSCTGMGFMPGAVITSVPRATPPRKFSLYPIPAKGDNRRKGGVMISVLWVDDSILVPPLAMLTSALNFYSQRQFAVAIIQANTALEMLLSPIMHGWVAAHACGMKKSARDKYAESFLVDKATYAHQLKFLLPLYVAQLGVNNMGEGLYRKLDKLRKWRNSLAHGSKSLNAQIDDDSHEARELAELMCTAVFGFAYLENIQGLEPSSR